MYILSLILVLGYALECYGAKVVVTGAAGRTGMLVMCKFPLFMSIMVVLTQPDLNPIPTVQVLSKLMLDTSTDVSGLVRTEKSIKKIKKGIKAEPKNIRVCDVTSPEALTEAFKGADAVVLCTSAVPQIKVLSIIKVLLLKLIRKSGRPTFKFAPNGDPYHVDWLGAKNQIDAAKAAGVKHFVFVGSMGGTQPGNFLNTIGRVDGDERSGNILLWKRKVPTPTPTPTLTPTLTLTLILTLTLTVTLTLTSMYRRSST